MAAESTTILSYNMCGGLAHGDKAPAVLDLIDRIQPTVAIFPEAYKIGDTLDENFLGDLQREDRDYVFHAIDQEVSDPRPDGAGLLIIAKRELTTGLGPILLSGRFAMVAHMYDPTSGQPFNFFGQHANDKNEELRVKDTEVLIDKHLLSRPDATGFRELAQPAVVAGDLNSTDVISRQTKMLHALGVAANALPDVPPHERFPGLRQLSLAQRLGEMVIGTPLAMLAEVGLHDIDDDQEPTMRKGPIAVKLDHILTSHHFEKAAPHLVLRGLTVDNDVNGRPLSDHDAIVGKLNLLRATQPA